MNMDKQDALLLVDIQNDFFPGGSLGIHDAGAIIPVVNAMIDKAVENEAVIYASRDWHPEEHISFVEQGGRWPRHCVRNTSGAAFHPEVILPMHTMIISKGTHPAFDQYSAFDRTELVESLNKLGIRRVWVGGLAQDICVKETMVDGVENGFSMILVRQATRPAEVNPGDGRSAINEMKDCGVRIVSAEELYVGSVSG